MDDAPLEPDADVPAALLLLVLVPVLPPELRESESVLRIDSGSVMLALPLVVGAVLVSVLPGEPDTGGGTSVALVLPAGALVCVLPAAALVGPSVEHAAGAEDVATTLSE
jgi:hypothetical protein